MLTRLCELEMTNRLTIPLFCDTHIDIGVTLNITALCLCVDYNSACRGITSTAGYVVIVTVIINSGSPPVFLECALLIVHCIASDLIAREEE